MNRKVLAIAVGVALATAGVAQAEVTIFGKAHVSADYITAADPKDSKKEISNLYISSNSSSLGFKDEEDLGNGLKAGLFFDTQIVMDSADTNGTSTAACTAVATGSGGTTTAAAHSHSATCTTTAVSTTSGIWDRQTYAYLSGDFGTVTMGKVESMNKLLGRKIDFFGDQIGDSRNMIVGGKSDTRPAGVIQYSSPKFGPMTAQVLYKPNEGSSTKNSAGTYTTQNTQVAVAGQYADGPIYVGVSYEIIGKGQNGETFAASSVKEDSTNMRIGATFTMGDAMIAGIYSTVENSSGTKDANLSTIGFGGSYKLGSGLFKAQYYMNTWDCSGATCDDMDGSMFAIGYDQTLSKKTKAYVAYAATMNDKAAVWSAVGAGHGTNQTTTPSIGNTDNKDSSGLSVGIIHNL